VSDIVAAREAYADALLACCPSENQSIRRAFATVSREDFLGAPPWYIRSATDLARIEETHDPTALYQDVLVAIDPTRQLNNGAPSVWASVFDSLAIAPGERVVHVGTGTGYYTAILAEVIGGRGHVLGVELDPELAERTRQNLLPWPWAEALCDDGTQHPHEPADVIVVSAGATGLADPWIDELSKGGRLYVPLSVNPGDLHRGLPVGIGAGLVVEKRPDGLAARFLAPLVIYPCVAPWSDAATSALQAAFQRGLDALGDVRSLRRDAHARDQTCWCHVDNACLSTQPLSSG